MAQKTITAKLDIQAQITQYQSSLDNFQKELSKLHLSNGLKDSFSNLFTDYKKELEKISEISKKGELSVIDEKTVSKSFDRIGTLYDDLIKKLNSAGVKDSILQKNQKAIESMNKVMGDYRAQLTAASKDHKSHLASLKDARSAIKDQQKKTQELQAIESQAKSTQQAKAAAVKQATDELKKQEAEQQRIVKLSNDALNKQKEAYIKEHGNKNGYKQDAEYLRIAEEWAEKYAQATEKVDQAKKDVTQATNEETKATREAERATENVNKSKEKEKDLESKLSAAKTANTAATKQQNEAIKAMQQALLDTKIDWKSFNVDPTTIKSVKDLKDTIDRLKASGAHDAVAVLENLSRNVEQMGAAGKAAKTGLDESSAALTKLTDKSKDLEQFKNRIAYFFGLTNAVNLFKRAIRSAFNTIKDLDKVMTETAVVTQFDVSDMWDQLPEYTKRANELGVSIHSAYESATIYYQQGLKTNEVIALSNQTLKMARIAGLDAADATDRMTNALRGFNMELNETNAERVADVYSKLAAMSASNVDEISTAMTKVASLASNANMQFETTAAFLSQIIETTRESAETAGTALKTVVARFSEVKKLYSEGELLGTDEEGEAIDVNKVSTALRSAGINLNEYLTGMKGLDDIFLELASKWDNLDQVQQRYIATMAAGSRQQSRFIAMMQDYGRTQELVNAANNAAGASNEQYQKTLDSLESKLNRLKNAWDEFLMGITNNILIKAAVGALTGLINVINGIISGISKITGPLQSFTKSLLSLVTVWGGLKIGKSIFNNMFASLGSTFMGKGKEAGSAFASGFASTGAKIKQVFTKNFWVGLGVDTNQFNLVKTNLQQIETQTIALGSARQAGAAQAAVAEAAEQSLAAAELGMEEIIKKLGIDEATYQAVRKSGLTINEQAILLNGSEASQKALNALASKELSQAEKEEAIANALANNQMKMGILIRLKNIASLLFGSKATRAQAAANLGLAKSTDTATIATGKFSAALMACPVGYFLAAIAAIVAVITIWDALVETSAEKLERLTEEAEKAAETANEANQALTSLISAKDGYNDLITQLKNLEVGTENWKQKLKETNNEVLNLIEEYPELAKYVENTAEGLRISEEGWNTVINTQQEVADLASGGSRAAALKRDIQEYRNSDILSNGPGVKEGIAEAIATGLEKNAALLKTRQIDFNEFNELENEEKIRALHLYTGLDEKDIEEDLSTVASNVFTKEGKIELYSPELERIAGQFTSEGGDISDTLRTLTDEEYAEQILHATNIYNQNRAKAGSIAVSAMSDEVINSGLFNNKSSAISSLYSKRILGEVEERGIEYQTKTTEQLQNEYYARTGKSGKELSDAEIRNQLLMDDIIKDTTKSIDAFYDSLKDKPKEKTDELLNILSEEADLLNPQELVNKLIDNEGGLNLDAFKTEFDIGFETLGMDVEDFVQRLLTEAERVEIANQQANDNFEQLGLATDSFSGLSGGSREKISNQLLNVRDRTGAEGVQKVFDILENAKDELPLEKFQEFANAFNLLDLSDPDSIKEFSEYLRSCGITASTLGVSSFEDLENSLIKAANAAKKLSTQNLDTQLSDRRKYANDIKNRNSYAFTPEQMAEAIANGASQADFEWNGENYTYIGGTMETLANAINANTDALLEATAQDLRNQVPEGISELASVINTFSSPEDWLINVQNMQGENTVQALTKILAERGVTQLENENGELTNIGEFETDELISILNNLFGKYAELQTVEGYKTPNGPNAAQAINEGEQAGLDSTEIVQYAEHLQQLTEAQEETRTMSHDMATEIAKDNIIMNQSLEELSSGWDEWKNALDPSLKGTDQYSATLNKLRKNMQGLLGVNANLSDAFLTDTKNMKLMEQAANGDLEAITKLRIAAVEDIILHTKLDEASQQEVINGVQDFINNVDLDDIKIGATLDTLPFGDALVDLINSTYGATEEAQAILNSLGFEPEVTYVDVPMNETSFDKSTSTYTYTDPITGEQKTAKVDSELTAGENGMLHIPIINGSKTTFRGSPGASINASNRPASSGGGGGGGGGGSSEKPSYWENPYDELYNLTEKINEAMRTREALEREYGKLLDERTTSTKQILQNSLDEIALLRQQLDYEKQMEAGRKRQVENIGSQMYTDDEGNRTAFSELGVMKYASYDFKTGLIQIDWSGLEEIANDASREEEGKQAEAYISKLEELVGQYEDVRDAIWEIEDKLEEIRKRSIDESIEFQQRIFDAIVSQKQAIIDSFDAMSQTIEETTSKVIDNVREQIQAERQQRQNEKTESDIADKEARLAYLSRDTSGANQLETMKLQKEIDDARQNYSDSLIDQAIDQMQKDADLAAEQRAQQIQIMQAQLDIATENGEFWKDVKTLLDDAFNPDGTLKEGSKLVQLLKDTEAFKGMSEMGQDQWINDMVEAWLVANEGLSNWKMKKAEEAGTLTLGNGTTLTYKDGKWTDGKNTYSDVGYDVQSGQFVGTNNKDYKPAQPSGGGKAGTGGQPAKQEPKTRSDSEVSSRLKTMYNLANSGQVGAQPQRHQQWMAKGYSNDEALAAQDVIEYVYGYGYTLDNAISKVMSKYGDKLKKYASGGLADYTGLAWLDGSKSKPESILSAEDTRNFITLRDVLAQFLGSQGAKASGSSGDNYFDIDINAEIGSDYDVDRLASQIKQQIYNDSTYRNVNAISYIR